MSNLIFYRDKKEKITCEVMVEGVNSNNTNVRLCLELENGENRFFKGHIQNNNECIINIPALKDINENSGNVFIEVIADNSYFKVFESKVEIKNKVNVKLNSNISEGMIVEEAQTPKITFAIKNTKPSNNNVMILEDLDEDSDEVITPINRRPIKDNVLSRSRSKGYPVQETVKNKPQFGGVLTFNEYLDDN